MARFVALHHTARPQHDIQQDMGRLHPDNTVQLVAQFLMGARDVVPEASQKHVCVASRHMYPNPNTAVNQVLHSAAPLQTPSLLLTGQPTQLIPSTAPLVDSHGHPLAPAATPLHAMLLHDRQVLIQTNFTGFPSTEVTLELWMQSIDICAAGVAFSYAAGPYGVLDNALLLFDYNNWCGHTSSSRASLQIALLHRGIAVMEDQGSMKDHRSGISSTHGQWTHVAITWRSADGRVQLYVDARLVATMKRAKARLVSCQQTR